MVVLRSVEIEIAILIRFRTGRDERAFLIEYHNEDKQALGTKQLRCNHNFKPKTEFAFRVIVQHMEEAEANIKSLDSSLSAFERLTKDGLSVELLSEQIIDMLMRAIRP